MNPNPDQLEVINSHEGEICVTAGPGAGKTATLIARHKSLLAAGVRPEEILSLTFTKSAADEMQKRAGKGIFKTFHSYGYSVLTAEKGKIPMEPELRNRLLYKLTRKYGLEYKALTAMISSFRHKNISPAVAVEEFDYATGHSYAEYEKERLAAGWMDFDSMIVDAVNLLENPEVRARHQWKYVMADECQDTDDLQFRLLQLISEKYRNVMCVGDPGQSIYMFRGAKPENLTDFTRWFPNGKTLYLGRNYRSSHIITQFVRENYPIETPLREKLLPARQEKGVDIEYKIFNNEFDEAEAAVSAANSDPLNSAILARTNRALGLVENFCLEHKIKFHLLGKSGFWKQSEIIRTVEKLKPYSNLPLQNALGLVMPEIERHYSAEDATPEDNYALENIRTLRDIGKRFTLCRDFVAFANRAAHARRQKGITLSTVHQAKGTEYKNVFVIGARDGMIPHAKGDMSEEKRIFFVAISRAKDRLRISWVGTPSPFLRRYLPEDILLTLIENAGKVERLQKQNLLF